MCVRDPYAFWPSENSRHPRCAEDQVAAAEFGALDRPHPNSNPDALFGCVSTVAITPASLKLLPVRFITTVGIPTTVIADKQQKRYQGPQCGGCVSLSALDFGELGTPKCSKTRTRILRSLGEQSR